MILGGSDTGGGTGYYLNSQLHLIDFKKCSLDSKRQYELQNISIEKITPHIEKLNSTDIGKLLENLDTFENQFFKSILIAAARRANFYFVDAELDQGNSKTQVRLATFKRPLGIIINKNHYKELSELERAGLLFHESLRMLSLGFDIQITEKEILTLTCLAFSQNAKKISLSDYSELELFFSRWEQELAFKEKDLNERQMLITNELSQLLNLDDIHFPFLHSISNSFLFQEYTSKFENLRNYLASSSTDTIENAFFSWASKEVPQNCSSKVECDYYEEWPISSSHFFSPFIKWELVVNNKVYSQWNNQDSRTLLYVQKNNLPIDCDSEERTQLALEFMVTRENLDYFDLNLDFQDSKNFCIYKY